MEMDEITFSVARNHPLCGQSICLKIDKLPSDKLELLNKFINEQYPKVDEPTKSALANRSTILNFIDGECYDKNCEINGKATIPMSFNAATSAFLPNLKDNSLTPPTLIGKETHELKFGT